MPGLDWMQAAALDNNSQQFCTVTQLKPPHSWKGTPAEEKFNLDSLTDYTVLFEGSAREAASLYPKNSNVACMLALATVGLDDCHVILATDPKNSKGGTTVEYESEDVGKIRIEVSAVMSKANPKTSAVVPLSVVKSVRNICGGLAVGV